MKTLDQLIADEEYDMAAEIVYRGLINSFNIWCPGINLTAKSLKAIAEPLKKKFEEAASKEE